MDKKDWTILEVMQKDGRIAMQNLASQISMSGTAAAERVRNLEKDGIITGYKANLNAEKLGYNVHCFVLTETSLATRDKFYEYVQACPEIINAYYTTTGGKELVLEMFCASTDDLYRIQEDLFGLAQCTTYIVANHPVKQKGITPLPNK